MLHLPSSLMNNLNKTESAVFENWMMYFQRIPSLDKLEIKTYFVVPCGGRNILPVYRFSLAVQGSATVMQHIVSVESSSLLLHSIET